MEFCSGGVLFGRIFEQMSIDEEEAQLYLACVVLALEKLHRNSIIHKDMKPENVLLNSEGYAILCDFGISQFSANPFSTCSTPEYCSPEFILQKQQKPETCKDLFMNDIWGLGCLLFEMVSGKPPFIGDTEDEIEAQILDSEPEIPCYLDDECIHLIEELLLKDPNQRLGCNGFSEIKSHEYFDGIDWSDLLSKSLQPIFVPETFELATATPSSKSSSSSLMNLRI